MSTFDKTDGHLGGPGKFCIVSFPATLGKQAWTGLISGSGGTNNYACVWTGNNGSPQSEWYDPWAANVDKAKKMGKKLLVIVHNDHPQAQFTDKRSFATYCNKRRPVNFRLGNGQIEEIKYLNKMKYKYSVFGFPQDRVALFPNSGPAQNKTVPTTANNKQESNWAHFSWKGPIKLESRI